MYVKLIENREPGELFYSLNVGTVELLRNELIQFKTFYCIFRYEQLYAMKDANVFSVRV